MGKKDRVKPLDSTLFKFDQIWCGNHQIPASLLSEVSENEKFPITLALFRCFLSIAVIGELVGYFFITFGFASHRPVWMFLLGVILKIGCALTGAFFQNKSGAFLSLELQKYLDRLKTHTLEIRSFLTDKGCSELELGSLPSLSHEVYQAELNSYQKARLLNIGAPLFCGIALFINGDHLISILIILLGLLSFPLGEKFFRENTFRKESELRLGLAAQLFQYVEKVYNEHVGLATKVNLLSQLPLLLFAFRFLGGGSGDLLASFFGITQGLIGLTGTLAFQKARVSSIRTTQTATHLIHALVSPEFIMTSRRWAEHCASDKTATATSSCLFTKGVMLKNFSPHVSFLKQDHFSLSCSIPSGSICLLKAPSGKGKSTFLAALTHLIEHTGNMFFIEQARLMNVHQLTREEFERKIFFLREENFDKNARILDLFKIVTLHEVNSLLEEMKINFNSLLVDLAWKAPDNLISQEIRNLETHTLSLFPQKMLNPLKKMREKQLAHLNALFKTGGGSLENDRIHPERNFSSLSSGERRRVLTLLALETCRCDGNISLVILDEPLTHLDYANVDWQMRTIAQLQKLPSAPAILMISHHFVEEVKDRLKADEISL
ncbi:MAG: ATP-binding cassette domain-containing protein [Verrucomicrobia bacterium]|nr:ATP-binding cassette domain-containing protein [Verrucomicrobiota bacterium]